MEIGVRTHGEISAAVEAGLRGLGVDPTASESPRVIAGTVDVFDARHPEGEGTWIAVEIGGIGGQYVDGIDGTVSVLDADGPCYACLTARVAAGSPTGESGDEAGHDAAARFAGSIAGRLLRRLGEDGLEAAVGTIYRLDGTSHRLLPVPHCACEGTTNRPRPPDEATPEGDALSRAETAVDPLLGPIAQVGEQSSYPAPYYIGELAETSGFSDATATRYSAGVDLDWDAAFMRAIGEGLERYCAGVYRLADHRSTPPEPAVSLESIPTATGDAESLGYWWRSIDLHAESDVWLPAETVWFPPPADAAIDPITTGLGLGETWTEAVLAGVLEVIERDACMLGWYSTFEPMGLETDRESVSTLVRRMAGEGLATSLLVMTQDIDVPVVTAVVHRRRSDGESIYEIPGTDPDGWPAFAVGSAASLDPSHAAERALAEAAQNWVELREMGEERARDEGAIGEFGSFPRQARGLVDPEVSVAADELVADPVTDPDDALQHCLDEVATAGLSAYAARTTTRDVEQLGFEAVRVVVPEAQPLVMRRAHLSERVRTVPRELGFSPRLDRGPHPYP